MTSFGKSLKCAFDYSNMFLVGPIIHIYIIDILCIIGPTVNKMKFFNVIMHMMIGVSTDLDKRLFKLVSNILTKTILLVSFPLHFDKY